MMLLSMRTADRSRTAVSLLQWTHPAAPFVVVLTGGGAVTTLGGSWGKLCKNYCKNNCCYPFQGL